MQSLYNSKYAHIFKGPVAKHVTYKFHDLEVTYANIPHLDITVENITPDMIYKSAHLTCSSLFRMYGLSPETDGKLWVLLYRLFTVNEGSYDHRNTIGLELYINHLTAMYEELKVKSELLACVNFALGLGYFYMSYFVMYNHKKGNLLNYLHELCHVIHRYIDQIRLLHMRNPNNYKIEEFMRILRDVFKHYRISQFYDHVMYNHIFGLTRIVSNILCGCSSVCKEHYSIKDRDKSVRGIKTRVKPASAGQSPVLSIPVGFYVNQAISIKTRFPTTGPELFGQAENVIGILRSPVLYHVSQDDVAKIEMCLKTDFYMTEFYNNKEANNYIIPIQSPGCREQEEMMLKLFNNVVFCMYLACQVRQVILSQWKILLTLFRNQFLKIVSLMKGDSFIKICIERLADDIQHHRQSLGAVFKAFLTILPDVLKHVGFPVNDSNALRAHLLVEYLVDDKFAPEIPYDTYVRMARDYRLEILRGNRMPFPIFTLDLAETRNLIFSNEAFHAFYNVISYDDIIPNYSSF
ncbi:protein U4 [Elephant endotheliotropic herpesvirus 1A]|uniref:Protein U4 n=6 Tax=Elephantid herpesvirus 1 TaxID=146015 RepID=VU4_ELHVK|nr:protein UL27 [Elephantid betaherpesvirus 1]Q18LF3.1 RecName: Full=Protein U4 [Elephantid herpesvirus 1 (isolate Kiba)]AGG16062.1 protein U4 [Elephant endotheliotropic herpesvirus 1A]ABG36566.1 U4 [Elephantid betaherpesvirus 1]AGE09913.1 protein UL27 [Elephantid betaherpesvirus 1]AGE10022.1 protein UL27 [Elephantid betaherpesvirus 1]QEY96073.1 protein UL27 [Elephant endotheliotropic herpesvirus 1A]